MWRGLERRPARSRSVTAILPSAVPGGTRTVQPERLRTSLAASAPLGQRNETRMPRFSPRPRTCSWRPTVTRTPLRQAFAVTGTQRSPLSVGAFARACAALATPSSASTNTSAQTIVAIRSLIGGKNPAACPR
jgi:hypothetical protein